MRYAIADDLVRRIEIGEAIGTSCADCGSVLFTVNSVVEIESALGHVVRHATGHICKRCGWQRLDGYHKILDDSLDDFVFADIIREWKANEQS